MLREKQQEQLQESMRSTSSGGIPRIRIHHSDSLQKLQRKGFIAKLPTGLVSALIFLVLVGAGVAVGIVIGDAQSAKIQEDATQLARETGQFFSEQLDKAILPLFSMAQFAVHLEAFQVLPELIGVAGADGSLPLNETSWTRNISGVCDNPELMETFAEIATTIKSQSGMDGILANIQLAPNGVICLLYPMNNTEDFKEDGMHLDNTPVWGLDIFQDPGMKYIALQSITKTEVGVAGPLTLKQCPECDPFFIARLPVMDDHHIIDVDGTPYRRWGFATAIIAWTALVEKSGVYDTFENNQFEFQLTRTDNNLNTTTSEYDKVKVVLAETPTFREKSSWRKVSTSLETTNNEWVMTVSYDETPVHRTIGMVIGSCVIMAFLIAGLVYTVLSQKHEHDDLLVEGYAQEARVATERNMTAYFAHELRNRKYSYVAPAVDFLSMATNM
jgi:sensor domain CHASE-containing protein